MTESSFQEKTAAAKTLFGVAAKLAQKQAELAKLNNVTLPKLYHAIGKRIVRMEELPTELGHHRWRKLKAIQRAALPLRPRSSHSKRPRKLPRQQAMLRLLSRFRRRMCRWARMLWKDVEAKSLQRNSKQNS
jgi:hypothetical protein